MNLTVDERLQAEAKNSKHLFQDNNGGYRPSAAALHTARILVKNFVIAELPTGKYQATLLNITKLLDVFTQAHKVEKVLSSLVQQIHWVSKHELEQNLEAFQEATRAIEIVRSALPQYAPGDREQAEVSAPAYAATQVLIKNYDFQARPHTGRIKPTFRNLAITVDVSMRIRVAQQTMDQALNLPWERKDDLRRCMTELQQTVRALEFVKNSSPHIATQGRPIWSKAGRYGEPELTRAQRQQLTETGKLLQQAKTPYQEQLILRDALKAAM